MSPVCGIFFTIGVTEIRGGVTALRILEASAIRLRDKTASKNVRKQVEKYDLKTINFIISIQKPNYRDYFYLGNQYKSKS